MRVVNLPYLKHALARWFASLLVLGVLIALPIPSLAAIEAWGWRVFPLFSVDPNLYDAPITACQADLGKDGFLIQGDGWNTPTPQAYAYYCHSPQVVYWRFDPVRYGCVTTDGAFHANDANGNNAACLPPPPPPPTCQSQRGNPCDAATGEKREQESDQTSAAGPALSRYYSSEYSGNAGNGFGVGWMSSLGDRRLYVKSASVLAMRPGRKSEFFTCASPAACSGAPDAAFMLSKNSGVYTLTRRDGGQEHYGGSGLLIEEFDPAGRRTGYTYDSLRRLTQITGPFGHTLTLTYTNRNQVASVTDAAGEILHYSYDDMRNLTRVDCPDDSAKVYHYEDTAFPHHLTGISYVDSAGTVSRYATFAYDADGKAMSTEHAGGMEKFTFSYDSDMQTTVTDAAGTQEVMVFAETLGVKNLLSRTNQSDGKGTTQVFDGQNNLLSHTDDEGRTTTYTYNADNQRLSMTEASGTIEARTTAYTYLSNDLDLPILTASPSVAAGQQKQVTTTYDAQHNPLTITQSGFTPSGAAVSRTITFQYNAAGQVIQIDGPRTDVTDVTTLEYYDACTTAAECGQLKSIANALGHKTTYDAYDADGQVTQMTNPNGIVSTFAYDPRGRILALAQTPTGGAARLTQYAYNAAGDIASVGFPDGRTLTYVYSAARKLLRITDNAGNVVQYGYDLKGNRTEENTYDPDGTLVRSVQNAYDIRNRLGVINAAGSITQLINDAVGNLISQIDPNANPPTTHQYDSLDRLQQTIDALNGETSYGYDTNDRLIRVRAPNNATTQYSHDDLGNLLEERSPDRGTLTYTYDDAGDIKTLTDARGTTTYSYDALNRLTLIDYPATEEDVTYIYDACPNGTGRLCTVQDQSGTTNYAYDAFGNVTQENHTELGITYVTAYTYDAGDRLLSMTYPSGRLVSYTRDALGRIKEVNSTVDGQTSSITQAMSYRADDLLTGQTFGNGLTETRQYDQQGRLLAQSLASADTRTYDYDANSNLVNKQTVPSTGSYSYDALDHLTDETLSNGTIDTLAYSYDGNGNRLARTENGTTEPYSYAADSNRLTAIDAKAVTLDAAGNTLTDAEGRSFTYNATGRISQVSKNGAIVGSYIYNSQGLRTRKVTARGTTVYHYDLQGNLIEETNAQGELLNQYLWANGAPVAASLQGTAPGVYTFAGTDAGTGNTATVDLDTEARTLAVNESGGLNTTFQPTSWQMDDTTQTLSVSYRTDEGTQINASFALADNPPTGELSLATAPRQARYRFASQASGVLTGTDPSSGESATLALDPATRTVTLTEHGATRTLTIPEGDWFSFGFGRLRLALFRYDVTGYRLFGLVLERGTQAEGWVGLTDGTAHEARYTLTGEAASAAARFVYLHTDHLNTPRLATDDTQTVLWRWEGEAFGATAPSEDVDGNHLRIILNLRFPGQSADSESGLYYNWNRYYDPGTGRYITSDPVGLAGDRNTYLYVRAQPSSGTDAHGLFTFGRHVDITWKAANSAGCQKIATPLGYLVGNVDFEPGSQNPENAYQHAMCAPEQDVREGTAHTEDYIESQMKTCTLKGLARALHAAEDKYAGGHQGCQIWPGGRPTWRHIFQDAFPGSAASAAEIEARRLIQRFKETCPCNACN
jgi:RHS repeat-associated protein